MTTIEPEISLWKQRRAVIAQYTDPDNRERFNNYRNITLDLWSVHPAIDRLVTNLALMMWGQDHRKRHVHLKVILVNLLMINTTDPSRYMGFYQAHDFYTDLYNNPAGISRLISTVMNSLTEDGLIEYHRGRYQVDLKMGYVSKVRATTELMDLFHIYGLTPAMITRHPDTEIIILRGAKGWTFRGGRSGKFNGAYIEYKDTPEITAMRERLGRYNRFMAGVELMYEGQVIPIGPTRRIFNDGSWNYGGRFYGGFWQNKKKEQRQSILLNGEAVTELDYGSLHAHLLYSRVGVMPSGDLYEIEDVPRKVAKHAVMLMIGTRRRSSVIGNLDDYIKADYPDCPNAEAVVAALESKHAVLNELWYRGLGLDLQNMDSQICDMVLTELIEAGIPCLSVYDSFIVPQGFSDHLRNAMKRAFREITGAEYDPPIG